MTLRSLEVFLSVVETGSMRAAAERLYISQPSVSGVVGDLEEEFQVRLFERLGKKLNITPEGQALAAHARRMLELRGEIGRHMSGLADRLPLRIGASVTVGSSVISELIGRIEGPEPYVFVGNTGMVEQKLLRNELDAALVEGRVESSDLTVEPLIRDELMLICRRDHPLAGRCTVDLAALSRERLILQELEDGARRTLESEFLAAGLPMNVGWECNNTQAILRAVASGCGVAILSPRLLPSHGDLAAVPISCPSMVRYFSLVVHKDKFLRPMLRKFLETCRCTDCR